MQYKTYIPRNLRYNQGFYKRYDWILVILFTEDKIRVNNLCPGLTRSEMVTKGSDFENNVLPNVSLGRRASAEEFANVVLFLASDESSYVTIMSMVMDSELTL